MRHLAAGHARTRLGGLSVALAALTALWIAWHVSGLRLIYNATESEPRGWYLARPLTRPPSRGDLVLFQVPASAAGLVAERGWLPPGVRLLKHVGAVAGDRVCVDATLRIRGEVIGPVLSVDAAERPLPVSRRGCFTVAPGYVFPVGLSRVNSFDARYVGEIPTDALEATAVPVWTFPRPVPATRPSCEMSALRGLASPAAAEREPAFGHRREVP